MTTMLKNYSSIIPVSIPEIRITEKKRKVKKNSFLKTFCPIDRSFFLGHRDAFLCAFDICHGWKLSHRVAGVNSKKMLDTNPTPAYIYSGVIIMNKLTRVIGTIAMGVGIIVGAASCGGDPKDIDEPVIEKKVPSPDGACADMNTICIPRLEKSQDVVLDGCEEYGCTNVKSHTLSRLSTYSQAVRGSWYNRPGSYHDNGFSVHLNFTDGSGAQTTPYVFATPNGFRGPCFTPADLKAAEDAVKQRNIELHQGL